MSYKGFTYIINHPHISAASATLIGVLYNVSTLNQCRMFSCVTVVCKHFASYQDYPNYKWDLIP
jgi:hypothetical protein